MILPTRLRKASPYTRDFHNIYLYLIMVKLFIILKSFGRIYFCIQCEEEESESCPGGCGSVD